MGFVDEPKEYMFFSQDEVLWSWRLKPFIFWDGAILVQEKHQLSRLAWKPKLLDRVETITPF